MNDIIRLLASVAIWAIVGIVLIAATINQTGDLVPLTFILGIGATGSTALIWNAGREAQAGSAAQQATKQKRNNRLTRMVEKLDEDEMAQLEDLLLSRQDESRLRDYE